MLDDGIGYNNGTTSPPTRKDIAQWGLYVKNEISVETVKNSWRHGEYSWFPKEDDDSNEGLIMFLLIIRNDTTIKVIIFILFWIAICHVVHFTFFLTRAGFSNKQWTRNDKCTHKCVGGA